jgi:hypothetical protein
MNSVSIRALFVMPPRTRARTAHLRSAWCSTCLGASLATFVPAAAVHFSLDCTMTQQDSIKCTRCISRKCNCYRISEGMSGDAFDFGSILQWIGWFWEPPAPQSTDPAWSNVFKKEVNEAVVHFVNGFKAAHKAHRKQHFLPGCKDNSKVWCDSLSIRMCFADASIGNRSSL